MTWQAWADSERRAIHAAGQWRTPRDLDGRGPEGELAGHGPVVSFASNDYLGLTQHPAVVAAAHDALDRWGAGSGSARLIVGSRPAHTDLERALAEWKDADRAALFPTGFAANLGVLTTFGGADTFICSDELNHASIIDGCRLSHADIAVYRHSDLDHLAALLGTRGDRRAVVVSDTVFSMDGDTADVDALAAVARHHDALLVLDEAHAVLGPSPRSRAMTTCCASAPCRRPSARSAVSSPGRRATSSSWRTAPAPTSSRPHRRRPTLRPRSPPSTSSAPRKATGCVARLRELVHRLRPGHSSPILPFVCGTEDRALAAAAALLEHGLFVPAIRPPTVAPGTARLRVALSAAHTDDHVTRLEQALAATFGAVPRS